MEVAYIIIVCFAGIGCSMASETTRAIYRLDDNSSDNYDNSDVPGIPLEPRKHKPYHDLFLLERKSGFSTVYLNPLRGIACNYYSFPIISYHTPLSHQSLAEAILCVRVMGGLQSLVGFAVIKIKVVLVAITIIGVVALALKIFGVFKYTSYLYKNDYPPVGPPYEFSGHPGPLPPHSPPPYDHGAYGNDWSSYSEHHARSTNGHRETATASQFPKSVNMTEIMYSFMNVNRDDCQARLICEFEMMLMRSPFFDYLMRYGITRRQLPESGNHSEDCTTYYTKCVEASANRQ